MKFFPSCLQSGLNFLQGHHFVSLGELLLWTPTLRWGCKALGLLRSPQPCCLPSSPPHWEECGLVGRPLGKHACSCWEGWSGVGRSQPRGGEGTNDGEYWIMPLLLRVWATWARSGDPGKRVGEAHHWSLSSSVYSSCG